MPFLVFGCSKLHREIEKTLFVTFCVALDEPDQLLCRCHLPRLPMPPRMIFATHYQVFL